MIKRTQQHIRITSYNVCYTKLLRKFKNLKIMQGILSGLRPAVVALIASAGLSIIILAFWGEKGFSTDINAVNFISVFLFSASLFIIRKYKKNPMLVMLSSGVIGGIMYLIF